MPTDKEKTSGNFALGIEAGEISKPSPAFKFGFNKRSEITFADLLYVNPEASPSDPSTWQYTKKEEEKVLGKSATENHRVVFLDPEIYGGKYKKPKIYIKRANHSGWLGLLNKYVPENDACEPRRENMLFLSEISKRVNTLESKIKVDKRLSYDSNCVIEPPFDLIASGTSHAYLHGIVLAIIRTYIVEVFLRCTPILSQVRFDRKNFDLGIGQFLLHRIEEDMKE